MNEAQIRQRLRDAVGETRVPPDLRNRIEVRLGGAQPMKGGSLMFGLGRTASIAAALLALLLVAAAVIGIRAWHDSLVNSQPASPRVQNPTVSQYQAMVISDEVNALNKQADACAVLGDACPTAEPRLAAALQKWLDDLNATHPPSRFRFIDAEMRQHVASGITYLNAALRAYNAGDQHGMDAAIIAAAGERDAFANEVDDIRLSRQASATEYTNVIANARTTLLPCDACQALAGPGQAPCNVRDALCDFNIAGTRTNVEIFQGNLVRSFAPESLNSADAKLQADLWAADQALVRMDSAWTAQDQGALQTAQDAFKQAYAKIQSDVAAF
jgi:hypothetical protein